MQLILSYRPYLKLYLLKNNPDQPLIFTEIKDYKGKMSVGNVERMSNLVFHMSSSSVCLFWDLPIFGKYRFFESVKGKLKGI